MYIKSQIFKSFLKHILNNYQLIKEKKMGRSRLMNHPVYIGYSKHRFG